MKKTKIFQLCAKRDNGIALMPWAMLYFFIAVYLFLLLFSQNLHISTKYIVQDALAAAALAGEVADLEVLSQYDELVITDLDYSRTVFEESLYASLNLTEQGYPNEQSVYFDSSIPVTVTALTIYNVVQGQVFQTDLLHSSGQLEYFPENSLASDSRCILLGNLTDEENQYMCGVKMLDGEEKKIKNSSLYAKISFGIRTFNGNTVILEKDILTDIQENN